MKMLIAVAAIAVAAPAGGAMAQSAFGDTSLSYFNGVVYDDDLVPGRGPNQSFLLGEQTQGFATSSRGARTIPQSSPNLIGRDGRVRDIRNTPSQGLYRGR